MFQQVKCINYFCIVPYYGFESEEEYDALFPTKEELLGIEDESDEEEDDCGETYDEVCGELSDD